MRPKGYLVFFCNDELLKFEIARDEAMIQMILTKGREFFACCREKREPALDPERDVYIPGMKMPRSGLTQPATTACLKSASSPLRTR